MYGATNLSIGISLILRDQFSGRMANARRELDLTTAAGRRAERASIEGQRNMAAAGAIAGVTALATMREWVKVGANFDKQMVYTYSIMDDKSGKSLNQLKQRAVEVGQDTMFSTTQVAEAMTAMAQAGQSAEQVYSNVNATAVLAAATMSEIQASSSAMTDIMIGFQIPASEKNAMHVADVITQSINQSNIHLKDFQESMKYIIPTATSLGLSLEEVAAMISAVGNAGIKGSMAGTNVENMVRYLAKATGSEGKGKQGEALAMMGLTVNDLMDTNGQLKPMVELVKLLGTQLESMKGTSGFNAMMDIFGVRGGRPANLLAKNMAGLETFLNNINNSGGTAQKTANDVMGTLWGGMERLESTWESFKIAFTEAIMPVLVPALAVITELLQILVNFLKQPIGKFITIAASGFVLIRTGAFVYKTVLLSLQLLHSQLGINILRGTSQGVQGYNNLTAAAQRAGAAMAGAGAAGAAGAAFMGTGPGGMQAMRKNSAGQMIWAQSGPGGRKGGYVSGAAAKAYSKARIGSMLGKASPYAMIGGLALNAASSLAPEDSGLQKGMNLAGAGLSGAATGAMLGSIVPGVGTAVGAVVGGVGSILWTLYDQTQAEKEKLKQAAEEAKAVGNESISFEAHGWAVQARAVLEARSRAYAYMGNIPNTPEGIAAYQSTYGIQQLPNGKQTQVNTQNKITVNIDGATAFNKRIDDNEYTANVQFSF